MEFYIQVSCVISSHSYCASLGHKANHSFGNNSKYDLFVHPRFGDIKCIRTLRDIKKGKEITVDYGYKDTFPQWYLRDKKEFEDSQPSSAKRHKRHKK